MYDPKLRKMHCPYCDEVDTQNREEGTGMEVCPNCGGPLDAGKYRSAVKCEYCGNYIIFEERVEKEYKPRFILPFRIDRKEAAERIAKSCGNRLFMPESFLSEASVKKMEGSYVPFWLYDMTADLSYRGTGTRIRVWRAGDTEYTETSWYQVCRDMEVDFQKLPVDASLEMKDDIMDRMEPYQYQELVDFDEEYMSGFLSEIYNETAQDLSPRAEQKAKEDAGKFLKQTLTEYATLMPQLNEVRMKNRRENYALLPVWWYRYRYREQDYDFFVNGQTGKVIGKAPLSKPRIFAYSGMFFGCMTAILLLVRQLLEVL